MNPADMARLRALAEDVTKTPVGITATGRTLFAKEMPVSPAAVLSLLDEVAQLREAAALAMAEPEPEGPMPDHLDRHSKERLARGAVISTKRNIASAIRQRGSL